LIRIERELLDQDVANGDPNVRTTPHPEHGTGMMYI